MCRLLHVVLLSGLVTACSAKKNVQADEAVAPRHGYNVTLEGKLLVIEKGDIEAYEVLFVAYQDTPFPEEFLSYAMLMSNKHGYPRAYYHVYEILSGGGLYRKEIEMIDDETANLAMKYLLKAHDLKYDEANELVHEYAMQYDESTNRRQIMKRFLE